MNDLPPGWNTASLREIAFLITDGDHNPPKRVAEGVPHLTARNVRGGHLVLDRCTFISDEDFLRASKRYAPAAGDVIVTCVGTLGETAIVPEGPSFSADRNLAAIRPRPMILSSFLKAMLDSPRLQKALQRGSGSTAQPHLYLGDLRELSIPLPSLGEQRKIVAAIDEQFSRLDAGNYALELARKRIKQLRSSILNRMLEEPDGSQVPKVLLSDVLIRGRYGTSTKCSYDGTGLPVLRIPNVQSGTIDLADLKYAIDTSVDIGGSRVVKGDILVIRTNGSRALIGKAAVVPQLTTQVAFASYLIQLQVDESTIDPMYLVAVLGSPRLRRQMETLAATTAGQYNINLNKLRSLRIPLPSLDRQRSALSAAQDLLLIADRGEREVINLLKRAERLRSAILADAFSGRLVPQYEEILA